MWNYCHCRCSSSHLNALNDLENGGAADDEDEERQEPRPHGVFVVLAPVDEGLGHGASRQDVLGVLLVGDAHPLLGGHSH